MTLLPVGKRSKAHISRKSCPELVGNTCVIEMFPTEPAVGLWAREGKAVPGSPRPTLTNTPMHCCACPVLEVELLCASRMWSPYFFIVCFSFFMGWKLHESRGETAHLVHCCVYSSYKNLGCSRCSVFKWRNWRLHTNVTVFNLVQGNKCLSTFNLLLMAYSLGLSWKRNPSENRNETSERVSVIIICNFQTHQKKMSFLFWYVSIYQKGRNF